MSEEDEQHEGDEEAAERFAKAVVRSLYYEKSKVKAGNRRRRKYSITNYGITTEEYNRLYDDQDGRCAICRQPEDIRSLSIDHNHKTGKVRGLLCRNCNSAIGLLKDSPARVGRAYKYLKKYEDSDR